MAIDEIEEIANIEASRAIREAIELNDKTLIELYAKWEREADDRSSRENLA